MAGDHLSKALEAANRMVAFSKAATSAGLPGALAGGESNTPFDPQARVSNAKQQYEANRSWVYACIRLIATRIAGQPIHVARVRTAPSADGMMMKAATNLEPLDSHPLLDLLADPWELGTAWSLMYSVVASLELTGRALLYVTEENGRPTLFPIPISWLEEVDRKRATWKIRLPGSATTIDLPGDRVVYFFYPDPANPWGALSPLQCIARAVNADENIEISQAKVFASGMHPTAVITVGRLEVPPGMTGQGPRPVLTPEQRAQLVGAARKAYSGAFNRHEPFVVDGQIESIEPFSLTPAELDFLGSSKVTKSRILQGFGISPILLGEVEGANRASATVADEIFCSAKAGPLIKNLSQTLSEFLGPMFARDGEKLVIWIEPAVAHDPELRFKYMQLAVSKPETVRRNEIRAGAGLPPLSPEEGGDEFVGPSAGAALPPAIDPAAAAAVKAILSASNPYTGRMNGRSLEKLAGPKFSG